MALNPADPIGTSSPPTVCATRAAASGGRLRLTAIRSGPARRGRRRRLSARHHAIERWQRHGACLWCAVNAQGHVHRPVVSAFTVFAGAVERVDHPYTLCFEASGVVECLLGKHRIVGAVILQSTSEQLLRDHVPRRSEFTTTEETRAPSCEQYASGGCRESRRDLDIRDPRTAGHARPARHPPDGTPSDGEHSGVREQRKVGCLAHVVGLSSLGLSRWLHCSRAEKHRPGQSGFLKQRTTGRGFRQGAQRGRLSSSDGTRAICMTRAPRTTQQTQAKERHQNAGAEEAEGAAAADPFRGSRASRSSRRGCRSSTLRAATL